MRAALSVVKVGGSLAADGPRLRAVLAGLVQGDEGAAVVVPGGGPFADAVRVAQAALGFDDGLAHRLALDAMGRMAEVFSGIEPRLAIAASVEAASGIARAGGTALWDPVALKAGRPDIPESWDVTSDSLALWLAIRLGAARCVLVKSAPCPPGAAPSELARSGLVDAAFPHFARAFAGEIVIRGPNTDDALGRSDQPASADPRPHREGEGRKRDRPSRRDVAT